jgi:multidrug efflux pump subunit AcrA (membrane-fusion protein)
MPYMTANIRFPDNRVNVLRVPVAALRWSPDRRRWDNKGEPRPRFAFWAKDPDGQHVHPVVVQRSSDDGTFVEVSGPDVKEGMEVVIGEGVAGKEGDNAENPFLPKMPKKPPLTK